MMMQMEKMVKRKMMMMMRKIERTHCWQRKPECSMQTFEQTRVV
jgi:hypothetical protein